MAAHLMPEAARDAYHVLKLDIDLYMVGFSPQ